MSEHFCVPVFTHFACRYYTSRQELASQEPLPGHSPLFELGPAIQRLGLRCMPLAPTPFQMTTTTTTILTTKNYVTQTRQPPQPKTQLPQSQPSQQPKTQLPQSPNTQIQKHKHDNHQNHLNNQKHTFKLQCHPLLFRDKKGAACSFLKDNTTIKKEYLHSPGILFFDITVNVQT